MDSPNSTTNRNSGRKLAIAPGLVKPSSDCPQPHWKIATMTPYAAATDSRLRMTAVSAMTSDRKAMSSRANASSSTKPNTHQDRCPISALKSTVEAVRPPTATVTPGTFPSVAGITLSRSVASAWLDVASSPFPASGTWMIAAVPDGFGMTVIGCFSCPVERAERRARGQYRRRTRRRCLHHHERGRAAAGEHLLDAVVGLQRHRVLRQVASTRLGGVQPEDGEREHHE